MERQPVTSSNIVSIGYDETSQILEIEFKGGATYRYSGVPSWAHDGMMAADSHGKYFNANIKGKYPESKL